jgi:hypothetical protein
MRDIEEYEAMRNLNPSTDKLGRDRDFQQNTANSLKWATDRINDMEQRLQLIEGIIRRTDD